MRRSPHTISAKLFREMKIKPKQAAKAKTARQGNSNLTKMKLVLKVNRIHFVTEYKFAPDRKFRSDLFLPELNVLIEYEGLIFSNSRGTTGKSGHTTISGYSSNCEKYNLATTLGYKLLRYTATTFDNMMKDINKLKSI